MHGNHKNVLINIEQISYIPCPYNEIWIWQNVLHGVHRGVDKVPWRVTSVVSKFSGIGCRSFTAGCTHQFRLIGQFVCWVPVQIRNVPEVSWLKTMRNCAHEVVSALWRETFKKLICVSYGSLVSTYLTGQEPLWKADKKGAASLRTCWTLWGKMSVIPSGGVSGKSIKGKAR